MTTTDWIIDIALIAIVFRQLREERLRAWTLIVPFGVVVYVAKSYLHGMPTSGNDVLLVALFTALGVLLGVAGGLVTRLRVREGAVYVKAGWIAATLWIASMTARLGFIIWITHASGQAAIGRFSRAHHITSGVVWQDALVLYALAEVVIRVGLIGIRGWRMHQAAAAAAAHPNRRTTASTVR